MKGKMKSAFASICQKGLYLLLKKILYSERAYFHISCNELVYIFKTEYINIDHFHFHDIFSLSLVTNIDWNKAFKTLRAEMYILSFLNGLRRLSFDLSFDYILCFFNNFSIDWIFCFLNSLCGKRCHVMSEKPIFSISFHWAIT
jgi:hypothetical protein